jgi:hypothetical protein
VVLAQSFVGKANIAFGFVTAIVDLDVGRLIAQYLAVGVAAARLIVGVGAVAVLGGAGVAVGSGVVLVVAGT